LVHFAAGTHDALEHSRKLVKGVTRARKFRQMASSAGRSNAALSWSVAKKMLIPYNLFPGTLSKVKNKEEDVGNIGPETQSSGQGGGPFATRQKLTGKCVGKSGRVQRWRGEGAGVRA